MNRRELLRASVLLPLASTVRPGSAAASGQPAAGTLHVTFLYHCAFAVWDNARRTDVILSPSSADPSHHGAAAHVASLRVPAACVLDDSAHPGVDDGDGDLIWRLEGHDLSVGLDDRDVRTTRSRQVALDGGGTVPPGAPSVFRLANLDVISGGPSIDVSCHASDPPAFLQHGSRVRLSGGHVGCGLPTTQRLREITWDLFDGSPAGLSDRVDFVKTVDGNVALDFRRFGESSASARRVTLQPDASGVVRAFISNDPIPVASGGGCPQLPHFSLYYLLSRPVGVPKQTRVPVILSQASLTAQGANSACCPCGSDGGTP